MADDVIDQSALKRLLDVIGGDREDFLELVEEFQGSTPQLLEKMQAAATNGDIDALRVNAHSLKSNGRDFGATALANDCEALEHACREGSVDDASGRVEAIATKLAEARQELTRLAAQ